MSSQPRARSRRPSPWGRPLRTSTTSAPRWIEALKKQEQEIRKGLNIFKIDQPPSKEITNLEKDLEVVETIWNLNKD